MDQLPDNFNVGPLIGPALPRRVNQRLEWFSEQRGYRATIESFGATVFKFNIWTEQLLEIGDVPESTITAGRRTVQGTLSFVTKETNLTDKSFWMLVYDSTGKRVATIHQVMLSSFSQEYTLDDMHIVEAEFAAGNMELHNATES